MWDRLPAFLYPTSFSYDSHELVSWVREFGNQIVPSQNPYFQTCGPPEAASKFENRGNARGRMISGYQTLLPARQAGRRAGPADLCGIKRLEAYPTRSMLDALHKLSDRLSMALPEWDRIASLNGLRHQNRDDRADEFFQSDTRHTTRMHPCYDRLWKVSQ